ncbi:MAG: hypothetical protein ACTJGM_03650 [Fusobacterium sp.]
MINITDFNKYEVTTQALPGKPLAEVLKESNTKKTKMCLGKCLEKVLTNENLRKDFEEKTRNKIKEFDSSFVVKEFEKLL